MPKSTTEYWRVVFNITPYLCNSITYTAVISEPIEDFLKRAKYKAKTAGSGYYNDAIALIAAVKTNKKYYELHRRTNPSDETYCTFRKGDYGPRK